jgi:hypothetical protein
MQPRAFSATENAHVLSTFALASVRETRLRNVCQVAFAITQLPIPKTYLFFPDPLRFRYNDPGKKRWSSLTAD